MDMTPDAARRRWDELLANVATLIPAEASSVLVDGDGELADTFARRLAAKLDDTGRARATVAPAHRGDTGRARSPDVVIRLRTAPLAAPWRGGSGTGDGGSGTGNGGSGTNDEAAIVVDLQDPDWPVIRRVAAPLAGQGQWYLTETRAFFAARAGTWDVKFGNDLPAYAAAIAQAGIPANGVVADVGCGTGRALPALRRAVGPGGAVIAIDLTPEMLREASRRGRSEHAALVLADARRLPLADASVDAVFAAGLISHLPHTEAGLRQLARITRPGGLLILFHPSGRAALAARHGRILTPDEPLAATPLERSTRATGWRLTAYDDAADRFFALAVRGAPTPDSPRR